MNEDFTTVEYAAVLELAKMQYPFASYRSIPFGSRFVLWRHDCDFSLNRALALARLEHAADIKATYFLNPHSEFYSVFEASQITLVQEILSLGHEIGVHFDAQYHEIQNEDDLVGSLAKDSQLLQGLFSVLPVAFSFHNPLQEHLRFEASEYAGLVNCYSHRFKTEVAYCSDSNGYWRYQRLRDVLSAGTALGLQVLTHADWWQEQPMSPRDRIFRCVYGRAEAGMQLYDDLLEEAGRLNLADWSLGPSLVANLPKSTRQLLDYLWSKKHIATLSLELHRLLSQELVTLYSKQLLPHSLTDVTDVQEFALRQIQSQSICSLLTLVLGEQFSLVLKIDLVSLDQAIRIHSQALSGISPKPEELLWACRFFAELLDKVIAFSVGSLSISQNAASLRD